METNKKGFDLKKFIITLIIFTICMFLTGFFSAKAFAYTEEDAKNAIEKAQDINNSSYPYKTILRSQSVIYLYLNAYPMTYSSSDQSYPYSLRSRHPIVQYIFDSSKGAWIFQYEYDDVDEGYSRGAPWTEIIWSSYDICYYDKSLGGPGSEVFFSAPEYPLLQQLIQTQALLPAQAQLLLLLPLLIPLVVGFLGLRKGLATLRTILNQG